MDIIWEELTSGLPDARRLVHVIIRLLSAALLSDSNESERVNRQDCELIYW